MSDGAHPKETTDPGSLVCSGACVFEGYHVMWRISFEIDYLLPKAA